MKEKELVDYDMTIKEYILPGNRKSETGADGIYF
jgi:hypothetical protein